MLLENKVVLITGASAGIGRATAIGAARHGADIAFTHFDDNDEKASETIKAIQSLGRRTIALKQDVDDPESAPAFVQEAVRAFGRIDVFVSNAGICPFHAFLNMPRETLERTMRVNLHGAYYMAEPGDPNL